MANLPPQDELMERALSTVKVILEKGSSGGIIGTGHLSNIHIQSKHELFANSFISKKGRWTSENIRYRFVSEAKIKCVQFS